MTNKPLNGRKLTSKQQLDRLVEHCFDRFDCASGLADLADLAEHERHKENIRAQRWFKRGSRYAQLRDWT
jgi:hypothetical protein